MSALFGVVRYEYLMGIRRWGVWLALGLAALPVGLNLANYREHFAPYGVWSMAGVIAMLLNLFMPVVGGIAMADRLHRDSRLGVRELLRATPLSRSGYVLGKYLGAVGAVLTPALVISLVTAAAFVFAGESPELLAAEVVAFVIVTAPAYLFIGAYSLACPAVLPLRVYQVLFTGYWFWGNFLNPKVFPTLAGTIVTPSGVYALTGLLSAGQDLPWGSHTSGEAIANIALLLLGAAVALFALNRYLGSQEARA
jgi:ABC-2 type transport system permease protein